MVSVRGIKKFGEWWRNRKKKAEVCLQCAGPLPTDYVYGYGPLGDSPGALPFCSYNCMMAHMEKNK